MQKNTANKANTQASHSFKAKDMNHKGFYDNLGEIHCVTLRCCLKMKNEEHSTPAGLMRPSDSRKRLVVFFIVFDSFLHFNTSLAPHECRPSLALQLPLIRERLATEPEI